MRFGISTHLYHERRLERAHLEQVAGYGFEAIELFATRSHFDYHDPAALASLAQWLRDTGVALHSVHAPITDVFGPDGWKPTWSLAVTDPAARAASVREAVSAVEIARHVPFETLVVHLGTPSSHNNPGDNHRGSALRSLEEICRAAAPLGVRVAAEVIPNRLSDPASLVGLIENDLDADAGICFDFGHAHMMGDVADAIETVSEHLVATHVHDNRGREDEHLVPYLGTIAWDLALVSMQKIGYDGTYTMELAGGQAPAAVLEEARRARQRFERTLTHA
jgi:sugar phosphate isomerase/epimerase